MGRRAEADRQPAHPIHLRSTLTKPPKRPYDWRGLRDRRSSVASEALAEALQRLYDSFSLWEDRCARVTDEWDHRRKPVGRA
jgi:hypothetical protein